MLPQRFEVRLAAFAGTMTAFIVFAACALAASSSWSAETTAPTFFISGKTSAIAVSATDNATAAGATIKDTLPAGVEVESVQFKWSALGMDNNLAGGPFVTCKTVALQVTCSFNFSFFKIEPGQTIRLVVNVKVPTSTPEGPVVNEATVEGGGLGTGTTSSKIVVSSHPPFGFAKLTLEPTEATEVIKVPNAENFYEIVNRPYEQPFTQAGGHPWALTSKVELATESTGANNFGEININPIHDPKDIVGTLPPGLLGDPMAVPRCSLTLVTNGGQCPGDTQVGVYHIHQESTKELLGPIVNVTPEAGQSAEFALENQQKAIITPLLTAHLVRTTETREGHIVNSYGFDLADHGVPMIGLESAELTFWGVPSDPSHDAMRGRFCGKGYVNESLLCLTVGDEVSHLPPVPFVSMPTDCTAGPQAFTLRADSWQEPGEITQKGEYIRYTEDSTMLPAVTGCNLLQFNTGTGVALEPETRTADQPDGLGVSLKIPLSESPETNTTPTLRDTTVTLPEGMSVSPGIVDGIEACDPTGPEGINIEGPESEEPNKLTGERQLAPGHCPDASTVGTAEAITPFLPTPVKGHVYLAKPGCGGAGEAPCTEEDVRDGDLYKLYLELGGTGQFANTGIQFKVPLETHVNPATGQLTAVSSELVQALYSEVKIHLNGGPRAPIANPAVCGPALTTADFTPWSAPGTTPEGLFEAGTPDLTSSSVFKVTGCAYPTPFKPGFTAGTVTPQAGQYSAFTMNLSREDGEQYVKGIQIHTPAGLLGMLSNVPLCGEPQADNGHCPESSKIGTTRVATGAGSHPFEIEGDVYLTGPYGGSPYGLSIVVNVQAGPFNLGLKVVRAQIAVDPETSQLTVTTDESGPYAVPQIVFGVPVRLKRITVDIDRPNFMFNPTDCNQLQIEAKISGAEGAVSSVTSPFAVAGCASLAFKPKFTATTSGRTSRAKGASLRVKLSYPAGSVGSEANVAQAKVDLPKQLPSRLTTLQQACTAAKFAANPASCPAASIVGVVKAKTPVLPVELTGPVYFVSHGGEAFPSLVVVLQGDGVRVDLTGTTFISKAGITSSTFRTVPDVPVGTFELYLPEGKYSALAANGNLCKSRAKLKMPTKFVAQNGAVFKQTTQIQVTGCASPAKASRARAKPGKHDGRAGK